MRLIKASGISKYEKLLTFALSIPINSFKSALFSKSAERVDAFRPDVASTMFADDAVEEDEEEVEAETETEVEAEAETEIGDEE